MKEIDNLKIQNNVFFDYNEDDEDDNEEEKINDNN